MARLVRAESVGLYALVDASAGEIDGAAFRATACRLNLDCRQGGRAAAGKNACEPHWTFIQKTHGAAIGDGTSISPS
jgi:hypothetical protein